MHLHVLTTLFHHDKAKSMRGMHVWSTPTNYYSSLCIRDTTVQLGIILITPEPRNPYLSCLYLRRYAPTRLISCIKLPYDGAR